jgi:hypothetical protein
MNGLPAMNNSPYSAFEKFALFVFYFQYGFGFFFGAIGIALSIYIAVNHGNTGVSIEGSVQKVSAYLVSLVVVIAFLIAGYAASFFAKRSIGKVRNMKRS